MTEEEKRLRKRKIRMALVVVALILLLLLLFPPGCGKQEKAPPPMPVEEQFPPPLLIVEIDEHPLKLSEKFKGLTKLYRTRVDTTYAVFDNWTDIRQDLVNWSNSSAGMLLYELVLPDGKTYAIPEAFCGKLMVVFDDKALAEKFVADNRLAVEMGVSIKELRIPEEE